MRNEILGFLFILVGCSTSMKTRAEVATELEKKNANSYCENVLVTEVSDFKITDLVIATTPEVAKNTAQEVCAWGLPLVRAYFPNSSPLPFRIVFTTNARRPDLRLPTSADSRIINVSLVLKETVQILSGPSFERTRPANRGPLSRTDLVDMVWTKLFENGMARYISSQGSATSIERESLGFRDLSFTTRHFAILDRAFARLKSPNQRVPTEIWNELVTSHPEIFEICGAFMAYTMETRYGTRRLVDIVNGGPERFWNEFMETRSVVLFEFPANRDLSTPPLVPQGTQIPIS